MPHLYGEPQTLSAVLGLAIVLMLAWPIAELIPNKAAAVLVGMILGAFCLFFGVLARKFYKLVLRLGTQ